MGGSSRKSAASCKRSCVRPSITYPSRNVFTSGGTEDNWDGTGQKRKKVIPIPPGRGHHGLPCQLWIASRRIAGAATLHAKTNPAVVKLCRNAMKQIRNKTKKKEETKTPSIRIKQTTAAPYASLLVVSFSSVCYCCHW